MELGMHRLQKITIATLCTLLLLCVPRTTINQTGSPVPQQKQHGDTITYTITFPDRYQRTRLTDSITNYLNHYPFAVLNRDSTASVLRIKVFPDTFIHKTDNSLLKTIEQRRFSEFELNKPPKEQYPQSLFARSASNTTPLPARGGTVRLFMQRNGIDATVLPLVATNPFVKQDSTTEPLFSVLNVTPQKITLRLTAHTIDGTGRPISALDIIEAWSSLIKNHPAEGLALFRHVVGIREFVEGREAVIRGLGASDQQTLYLRLDIPDTLALHRIQTARLCGMYTKMGPYYPAKATTTELTLLPRSSAVSRAFLDTLLLTVADDPNPILSFSLKKYDVISLLTVSDLSYARSTLSAHATLTELSHDRYFIACAQIGPAVRRQIKTLLNPSELLKNSVQCEGEPITELAPGSPSSQAAPKTVSDASSTGGQPLTILFRKDDVISRTIAEKLLADLSGNGVPSRLIAASVTDYERKLFNQQFSCAVGWVPEKIAFDTSEQLRCATMWFNDVINEQERIALLQEIPLFSINRYLLMRKPIELHGGTLLGICTGANEPMTHE